MLKLLLLARGKRLLIFRSPAAQAPPPPVRVNPLAHLADAQVLATPPESVQFVEPVLATPIQISPPRLVAQVAGVAVPTLLCVNTMAGKGVVGTTAGVPTKLRLFVSPVKPVESQVGASLVPASMLVLTTSVDPLLKLA